MIHVELVFATAVTIGEEKDIGLSSFVVYSTKDDAIIGKTNDANTLARILAEAVIDRATEPVTIHSHLTAESLTITTHTGGSITVEAGVMLGRDETPPGMMFVFVSGEGEMGAAMLETVIAKGVRYLESTRSKIADALFRQQESKESQGWHKAPSWWHRQFCPPESGEQKTFRVTWKDAFSWEVESYGIADGT
jgi:hypothetical protein